MSKNVDTLLTMKPSSFSRNAAFAGKAAAGLIDYALNDKFSDDENILYIYIQAEMQDYFIK